MFQYLLAQPFTELDHPFLAAGGAKIPEKIMWAMAFDGQTLAKIFSGVSNNSFIIIV